MNKSSKKRQPTAKSAPPADRDFWQRWIFLYASALGFLALPSICIWLSRGFNVTAHEFDFFIGLLDFGNPNPEKSFLSPNKTAHFFLLGGIGILFAVLTHRLYKSPPARAPVSNRAIGLLALLSIITLPYISPDVFFYLGTGWLEAHYHLSPFRHYISEVPGSFTLPMFSNIFHDFQFGFSCYGPLFQKIAALFAWLSLG
jgi:hypothetical protein